MDRLRPCPTPPNGCVRTRCRPTRSVFFRAGVRILNLGLAVLALADGQPGFAPGPVVLPSDARVVQYRPDGVRAHFSASRPVHAAARVARCSTTGSPCHRARDLANAETPPKCGPAPPRHL